MSFIEKILIGVYSPPFIGVVVISYTPLLYSVHNFTYYFLLFPFLYYTSLTDVIMYLFDALFSPFLTFFIILVSSPNVCFVIFACQHICFDIYMSMCAFRLIPC